MTDGLEPLVWRSMESCPRTGDGFITGLTWIAYSDGRVVCQLERAYLSREHDSVLGRVGWLPGVVDRAVLPGLP